MSENFTLNEKIQYALKTALNITAKTAFLPTKDENSAPFRIFPNNIQREDLIRKGVGDITSNGQYVTGHINAGMNVDMLDPYRKVIKDYKIIDPITNVITQFTCDSFLNTLSTDKLLEKIKYTTPYGQTPYYIRKTYNLSGSVDFSIKNVISSTRYNITEIEVLDNGTMNLKTSQDHNLSGTLIASEPILSTTYVINAEPEDISLNTLFPSLWSDSLEVISNNKVNFKPNYKKLYQSFFCDNNTDKTYKGLRLAYGHAQSGIKCNENINKELFVKHISLYYKVKTELTVGGYDGKDNASYYSRSGYLQNLLGLEVKFNVGVCSDSHEIIGFDSDGNTLYDWYTQPTYGLLSFYGISGGLYNNPSDWNTNKASYVTNNTPYITFLRYIGETVNFDKTINDICSNKIDPTIDNSDYPDGTLITDACNNLFVIRDKSYNLINGGGTGNANIDICSNIVINGSISSDSSGSLLIDRNYNLFVSNDGSYNLVSFPMIPKITTSDNSGRVIMVDRSGNWILSQTISGALLPPTDHSIGGVRAGDGININHSGIISVKTGDGLEIDANKVSVKTGDGLEIDSDGTLSIDKTLLYDIENQGVKLSEMEKEVKIDTCGNKIDPLTNVATQKQNTIVVDGCNQIFIVKGVSYNLISSSTENTFTKVLEDKLESIDYNANNYVLPKATITELGGVKKGTGVEIDSEGTLSMDKTILYNIENQGVKLSEMEKEVKIDTCGNKIDPLTNVATQKQNTIVVDGCNQIFIVKDNSYNLISSSTENTFTKVLEDKLESIDYNANNYVLPKATITELGGVKKGTGVEIDSEGKLSIDKTILYNIENQGVKLSEMEKEVKIDTCGNKIDPLTNVATQKQNTIVVDGCNQIFIVKGVSYNLISSSTENTFTKVLEDKLESIDYNANNYVLPKATKTELGGVKKGDGLEIDSEGTLSIDKTILYNIEQNTIKIDDVEIKPASETKLGGVKKGTGVEIDSDGTLSIDKTLLYNIENQGVKLSEMEKEVKIDTCGNKIDPLTNVATQKQNTIVVDGCNQIFIVKGVSYNLISSSTENTFTKVMEDKLESIDYNANNYVLPNTIDVTNITVSTLSSETIIINTIQDKNGHSKQFDISNLLPSAGPSNAILIADGNGSWQKKVISLSGATFEKIASENVTGMIALGTDFSLTDYKLKFIRQDVSFTNVDVSNTLKANIITVDNSLIVQDACINELRVGKLIMDVGKGLETDKNGKISIKRGDGLEIDSEGTLSIDKTILYNIEQNTIKKSDIGSGIDVRGEKSDLSQNDPVLTDKFGYNKGILNRSEGDIIYDTSENIFYEASRSKNDSGGSGELKFRESGYSFFKKNMQGQPPAPNKNSFFFSLTSKKIIIEWENPTQYETGLTGSSDIQLTNVSPIVTPPNNNIGGQYWFPIVNRIMIQIKNLDDNTYQTWGDNSSNISKNIVDMSYGRVICEKDRIIPPAKNGTDKNSYFGPTYDTNGREQKVYKLKDFANSIVLYKDENIDNPLEPGDGTLIDKRVYSAKQNSENSEVENKKYTLPESKNGFEIEIWLENEYNYQLTKNDFNIVKLNKIVNVTKDSQKGFIGQPINFVLSEPPTKIYVNDYSNNYTDVSGYFVELNRYRNKYYIENIVPKEALNQEGVIVTKTTSEIDNVNYRGYFVEYQRIEVYDSSVNNSIHDISNYFIDLCWNFVSFDTIGDLCFNKTLLNDDEYQPDNSDPLDNVLWDNIQDICINSISDPSKAFIAASKYSGGWIKNKSNLPNKVSKAELLEYGDTNAYRFRIRAINNANKNPGDVNDISYAYIRPIAPPTEIMVQDYSTNYMDAKGYYVDLNQDASKIYIRHIVPPVRDMIMDGNKVESTQTVDYINKINFKGYFVEYQYVDVSDISVNDPITDLSNSYFSRNNNSWNFISFNTVGGYNETRSTISGNNYTKTSNDIDASLSDICWNNYRNYLNYTNLSVTNDPSKAFISAGTSDNKIYDTLTTDISYHVIKANILNYGDTNAYRFRIRAINNQSKIPGPSDDPSYTYIRPIAPPTKMHVENYNTDYANATGYYVDLSRNKNINYIENIIPTPNNTMVNGKVVQSTQTNDYKDKINFKGYFVEYQSVDVSVISVNDPITDLSNRYFTDISWKFIAFNTVGDFSNNKTRIGGLNKTDDIDARLYDICWNPQQQQYNYLNDICINITNGSDPSKAFIAASDFSSIGILTKTNVLPTKVSKAKILYYGDTKSYRFRIRAINNHHKIPGNVNNSSYTYIRPIAPPTEIMVQDYSTNYTDAKGYYVELKQHENVYHIENVVPPPDNTNVKSTLTEDYINKINFKGYFVEFQKALILDASVNDSDASINDYIKKAEISWNFVSFDTIGDFSSNKTHINNNNETNDTEARLYDICWNPQQQQYNYLNDICNNGGYSDPSNAFIAASNYTEANGVSVTTNDLKTVKKSIILDHGDTNAYRYRIRAINNQHKVPGNVSDVSFALIRPIAPSTKIMVQDYSTNYTDAKGYYVDLNQDASKIYIRHVVPPVRDMIIDGNKVESTQTNDYNDKIHFKGYFVEYQTLDILDSSINHSDVSINSYFNNTNINWSFVSFDTVGGYNETRSTISGNNYTKTSNDSDASLSDICWNNYRNYLNYTSLSATNDPSNAFISAGTSDNKIYATATSDISYHVIKANILDYGDTKSYRFRIRGVNNQSKIPGQVSDVSFALIRPIGEPGIVPVADISGTNGFHVRLKRNGDDHYLKFIVPATEIANNMSSTQTNDYKDKINVKGYFIEQQYIQADLNVDKNKTEMDNSFNDISWTFVNFDTVHNFSNDKTNIGETLQTLDTHCNLGEINWDGVTDICINSVSDPSKAFIAASYYTSNSGVLAKTVDISYDVMKAIQLKQGDNKYYRFRIRAINNHSKKPGPVSTEYAYFTFNKPDEIEWDSTKPPKFIPTVDNSYEISLNWLDISSSKGTNLIPDSSFGKYSTDNLKIQEYKLIRINEKDSTEWKTVWYFKNTIPNNQLNNYNYQIYPTLKQMYDNGYATTTGWDYIISNIDADDFLHKGEDRGSTAKKYPIYTFKLEARNYLFGTRKNSNGGLKDISKQWLDSTDISDSRWSDSTTNSSVPLDTSAHTITAPFYQNDTNGKYAVKLYEQNRHDVNNPWKNNNNSDYQISISFTDLSTNRNNYTKGGNVVPTEDYISFQWKLSNGGNTTRDTSGLIIDRYEISYNYFGLTDVSNFIYAPTGKWLYGPANWFVHTYPTNVKYTDPSFHFQVRSWNFFNSQPSPWSDIISISADVPSQPQFLNTEELTNVKKDSKPTFLIDDSGLTILVDEPQYTGKPIHDLSFQDHAVSLSSIDISSIQIDETYYYNNNDNNDPSYIMNHSITTNDGTHIVGDISQVARFFHPNGYKFDTYNDSSFINMDKGEISYNFYAKSKIKNTYGHTSTCSIKINNPYNKEKDISLNNIPRFYYNNDNNKVYLRFKRDNYLTSENITAITNITPNVADNIVNDVSKILWQISGDIYISDNKTYKYDDYPDTYNDNSFVTISSNGYDDISFDLYMKRPDNSGNKRGINVRIRNQYNKTWTKSMYDISIQLVKPDKPTDLSMIFTYATSDGSNNLDISWNHPEESGLTFWEYENNVRKETIHKSETDNDLKIKKYDISLSSTYLDGITSQIYHDSNNNAVYSTNASNKYNIKNNNNFVLSSIYQNYTIDISASNFLLDSSYSQELSNNNGIITYLNGNDNSKNDITTQTNAIHLYPPYEWDASYVSSTNEINKFRSTNNTYANYDNSGRRYKHSNESYKTIYKLQYDSTKIKTIQTEKILINRENVRDKINDVMRMYLSYNGSLSNISNIFDISYGITKNGSFIFKDNASSNKKEIGKITYKGPYDIYTSIENSGNWFKFDDVSFNLHPDVSFSTQILDGHIKDISLVIQYKAQANGNGSFPTDIEFIERITPDGDNTYFETDGIGAPTFISKNISYIPFTCLGLPILGLSSGYPLIDICFNNKSTRYLVENSNITVEFGVSSENSFVKYTDTSYLNYGDVVKGTSSDNSNIVWNKQLIDIDFSANSTATGTSSPKMLQFSYKFKNIYGESSWTVDPSLLIWDKNTLDLIDTINNQNINDSNLKLDTGENASNWAGSIHKKLMTVLKVPANFDPSKKFTSTFNVEKIDLTEDLWTLNTSNKRSLLIYNGYFVSEKYFKDQISTYNDGDFHENVKKIIDVLPATPTRANKDALQKYQNPNSNSNETDILKDEYRWVIFKYQIENTRTSDPDAYPLYIEFELGSDNNIVVDDLYNIDGKTSKVEIWSKLRSGNNETRWSKLIHDNKSLNDNLSTNLNRIEQPYSSDDTPVKSPASTWYLPQKNVLSSWPGQNNSEKLITIGTGTAQEYNALKCINNGSVDGSNKLKLFLAIGLHNSFSKYIKIPKATTNVHQI